MTTAKIYLKGSKDDKTTWDHLRLAIRYDNDEPIQLFGLTREQTIELNEELFPITHSESNDVDREFQAGRAKVTWSPATIAVVSDEIFDFVCHWAMTANENDWLEPYTAEELEALVKELGGELCESRSLDSD